MYAYQDERYDYDPLDRRDEQLAQEREDIAEPCPCCGRMLPRSEWCTNDEGEE